MFSLGSHRGSFGLSQRINGLVDFPASRKITCKRPLHPGPPPRQEKRTSPPATRLSDSACQLSKNYKPFLWRRLRAKPFVAGLLNCTDDVPKLFRSDSARAENSNLTCAHECRSCLVRRHKSYCATGISSNGPGV